MLFLSGKERRCENKLLLYRKNNLLQIEITGKNGLVG